MTLNVFLDTQNKITIYSKYHIYTGSTYNLNITDHNNQIITKEIIAENHSNYLKFIVDFPSSIYNEGGYYYSIKPTDNFRIISDGIIKIKNN